MKEETINQIVLRGFVVKDPQVRYFSDTNVKAYFPLVTYDVYKSQTESKRISEFHNVVAWKEQALKVEDEIQLGQLIELTGRLKTHKYEKNGEIKLAVQITVADFKVLKDAPSSPSEQYPPTEEKSELTKLDANLFEDEDEDDLPF